MRPAKEVLITPGWREMQITLLDSAVSRRWRPLENKILANLEEPESVASVGIGWEKLGAFTVATDSGYGGFGVEIFEFVHGVEQSFGLCTESCVVQLRGYLSILMRRRVNRKDIYKYTNRNNSYVWSFFLRGLLEEWQESGGKLECADMARR